MSFRTFFFSASSIITGGIVVSEYFFYKLDPRLEKIKKDMNDLMNKQKEDVFQRMESYPNKIMENTKSDIMEKLDRKIDQQKIKFVDRLIKSADQN